MGASFVELPVSIIDVGVRMLLMPQDLIEDIAALIEDFDFPSANALVDETILALDRGGIAFDAKQIKTLLAALRGARQFETLARLTQALMRGGYDDGNSVTYAPMVRRQYAQALIEMGQLQAAIDTLELGIAALNLVLDGKSLIDIRALPPEAAGEYEGERREMLGLLGRANKQIYVDGVAGRGVKRAARHLEPFLSRAILYYGSAAENRSANRSDEQAIFDGHWPLMNMVALAARRERDGGGGGLAGNWREIAAEIASVLERQAQAGSATAAGSDPWLQATLGEACVAGRRFDDAMRWYGAAADHASVDAFQIASSIRQLEEVWGIDPQSPDGGGVLIQYLRTRLAEKPGGGILLGDNASQMLDLVEASDGLRKHSPIGSNALEQLRTLRAGVAQARFVAGVYGPYEDRPLGTAFLVRGRDLHPSFGDRPVALTAAHVVSNVPGAVPPEKAWLQFNEFASDSSVPVPRFRCGRMLHSAAVADLDFTVLEIEGLPDSMGHVKAREAGEIPTAVEGLKANQRRCWVLGHAEGGDLSLALDNSRLLDIGFKRADRRDDYFLRYSASTLPGQSGGPVFDRKWKLIGLHQAGIDEKLMRSGIRRLSGRPGRHVANEGISLRTIVEAIARDKRGPTVPGTSIGSQELPPATADALIAAINDPGVPDGRIEAWFGTPGVRTMLEPPADDTRREANRDPVGFFGYGAIIGVSQALRFRRNAGFDASCNDPSRTRLTLVSEGDSWFQFPYPTVKDTIDHLSMRYPIYCRAIAGMEITSILADTSDVMQAIREKRPDGVLLSGGGNDLLGYGNVKNFVRKFEPGLTAEQYLNQRLGPEIELIVSLFEELVADARAEKSDLKFFIHGYDRATTRNHGKWLRKPLRDHRGIVSTALQNAIVAAIVDRFNDALAALADRHAGIVHHVDCRDAVGAPSEWFDELHPNTDGFGRVAHRFDRAIRAGFKGHPAFDGKVSRLDR